MLRLVDSVAVDGVLVTANGPLVHAVFVAAGVTAAGGWFWLEVRRRGAHDQRLLGVVVGGLVGGGIGMRAAGLVHALAWEGDGGAVLTAVATAWSIGVRSVLGGLAGAYAGVLIGKRLTGYPYRTGDLFAPAVALGLAVGRLGCLLTEPLGTSARLPWAIEGRHPVVLYEIVFHLLVFAVLLRLRHAPHAPGVLFTGFVAAYAAVRFLLEFLSAHHRLAYGLTGSQLFLLVVAPLITLTVVRTRWRLTPPVPADPGAAR
jgi:phosphatidylglycerol---prolipoprotein diacylglyceryl transferase